jgi:hypothetical protein
MTKRIALFLTALVGGCGAPEDPPAAEVSGTVYHRGKPLTGGLITFVSDRGRTTSAVIDPTGRYRVRVRVGETKVTVNNLMLRTDRAEEGRLKTAVAVAAPDVKGTYLELPKKYRSADQSGLSLTVRPGEQT